MEGNIDLKQRIIIALSAGFVGWIVGYLILRLSSNFSWF